MIPEVLCGRFAAWHDWLTSTPHCHQYMPMPDFLPCDVHVVMEHVRSRRTDFCRISNLQLNHIRRHNISNGFSQSFAQTCCSDRTACCHAFLTLRHACRGVRNTCMHRPCVISLPNPICCQFQELREHRKCAVMHRMTDPLGLANMSMHSCDSAKSYCQSLFVGSSNATLLFMESSCPHRD